MSSIFKFSHYKIFVMQKLSIAQEFKNEVPISQETPLEQGLRNRPAISCS